MSEFQEAQRRKHGAAGTVVALSDGAEWLLANPAYRPRADGLTDPPLDLPLDRIFDGLVLGGSLDLRDVWEVARALLLANYDLTDDELSQLLSVTPGAESQALAGAVLEAAFGSQGQAKTYTRWVRASLQANGLVASAIPASDLADVLSVLVATHRTVPLARFADVCQEVRERDSLESLI